MQDQFWNFFEKDRWDESERGPFLVFLAIFLIYLGLRFFGLASVWTVEDHDSIEYLKQIGSVLGGGVGAIYQHYPDATPFYPISGAFFSLPGWGVETGARLASLFFSGCLFFALLGIARQSLSPVETAAGLLLVSFNPYLIRFSYSVLTEPAFVGTVYIGLCLFWISFNNPKLWQAGVLGLISGLAFLNRLEGVLYLAFFPFLQLAHFIYPMAKTYTLRHLVLWTGVFAACFMVLAAPQVWLVSEKMEQFALNGRQVWSTILSAQDGKSYEEKIYGLDYSPSEINLSYLQANPNKLGGNEPKLDVAHFGKLIANNFEELYLQKLGLLIGPLGISLFFFGLLALWVRGQRYEILLVFAIIAVGIFAPLLHNVVSRHVAIILPIILLMGGPGVVYVGRAMLGPGDDGALARRRTFVGAGILAVAIAGWAVVIGKIYTGRDFMKPFLAPDQSEYVEPAKIVKRLARDDLGRIPSIASRKGFFPHSAGAKSVALPHTDIDGLVRYSKLNGVDFLFLDYGGLESDRVFLKQFSQPAPPRGFELVFRGTSSRGGKIELYRFLNAGGTE